MKQIILFLSIPLFLACAAGDSIFPALPTSINASELDLPNPIDIVADPANDQIIVVNSDVDFFYDQGSLMTIEIDAADPASPTLTATSVTHTPRFAGQAQLDGADLYVSFREAVDPEVREDQIIKYTVGAGGLAVDQEGEVGWDPFGIALANDLVYVISNNEINILDAGLDAIADINLTVAHEALIPDTGATQVESLAIDATTNLGFVSNRKGKMFIIDLNTNELVYAIDGPDNTRDVISDGTFIYAVDGNAPSLWIFDPSRVPPVNGAPDLLDDSVILVDVIDLGTNPNGIAVDAINNRLFVANSTDTSIAVIDLNLLEGIGRISLHEDDTGLDRISVPFGLEVGVFGGIPFLFVANFDSNNIAVINSNTLQLVGVFP